MSPGVTSNRVARPLGAGGTARHKSADRTIDDVRLTAWQRWPMLVVLVTIFLVGGKAPVWENPFDIDRAIWLSYAPIPILVAGGLAWKSRLSVLTLFLNTLEIVLTKFALTYCIAIPLWALSPRSLEKPIEPSTVPPSVTVAPVQAPAPTPWPDDRRLTLRGTVRDTSGATVGGAFVYVSSGLEQLEFTRPAEPATIALGGDDFEAPLFPVRRWQPLAGRSSDGRLHTFLIETDDQLARNVPLLPSGEPSSLKVHDLNGIFPVRCTVHRRRAHLAVLHHPHFGYGDERGRITLEGVPAIPVTLTAWTPRGATATDVPAAAATAGATVELTLTLDTEPETPP